MLKSVGLKIKHVLRNQLDWLRYLYQWVRNPSRFFPATPFGGKKFTVFDTLTQRKITLATHDAIDIQLVKQIFLHEDYHLNHSRTGEIKQFYEDLIKKKQTPLIIDCGANRGFATRYFCETFSHSKVIAIEPNEKNLEIAKTNISGNKVIFERACIGSEQGFASLQDPNQGHWSFRTQKSLEGVIPIVTVDQLLEREADCIPFLIKIDIEGFENDLFSKNTSWIDRFPLLIIELHDWMLPKQNTSQTFLTEMAKRDRDFIYRGENVFSFSNLI